MGYYFTEIPEPPDDDVNAYCSSCKGEIYMHEEYTLDGERVLCADCIDAEFTQLPLWAKAGLMGYEVRGGALCRR